MYIGVYMKINNKVLFATETKRKKDFGRSLGAQDQGVVLLFTG